MVKCYILFLLLLFVFHEAVAYSGRTKRKIAIRKGSRVFVRYNVKINCVPYTAIFALANGFRLNWDIVPMKAPHVHRRAIHTALEHSLNRYGFDGRACMLRALCETGVLASRKDFISKLYSLIFKSDKEVLTCAKDIQRLCPFSMHDVISYLVHNQAH